MIFLTLPERILQAKNICKQNIVWKMERTVCVLICSCFLNFLECNNFAYSEWRGISFPFFCSLAQSLRADIPMVMKELLCHTVISRQFLPSRGEWQCFPNSNNKSKFALIKKPRRADTDTVTSYCSRAIVGYLRSWSAAILGFPGLPGLLLSHICIWLSVFS